MQENQEKEAALSRLMGLSDYSADDLARQWGAYFLAFFTPFAFSAFPDGELGNSLLSGVSFMYCIFSYIIARKRGWSGWQGILAFLLSNWVLPLFVAVKGEIRKDGRMKPKARRALRDIVLFWLLAIGVFLYTQ